MGNTKKLALKPADILLKHLSEVILDYRKESPILVGIDGVDASGKTTLADNLAAFFKPSKRQIIRASIDGFHNPRAVRYKQGKESPAGYYQDSFNNQLIIEKLLKPLSDGNLNFIERVFDYRIDKEVIIPAEKAEKDAILIMDGIFLFRPELTGYWDIKIYLDVGFDVTISRAITRAKELEPLTISEKEIIDIYNRRYVPGQKLYFQEARPQEKADILIDNTDYDSPIILRTILKN